MVLGIVLTGVGQHLKFQEIDIQNGLRCLHNLGARNSRIIIVQIFLIYQKWKVYKCFLALLLWMRDSKTRQHYFLHLLLSFQESMESVVIKFDKINRQYVICKLRYLVFSLKILPKLKNLGDKLIDLVTTYFVTQLSLTHSLL